jgi:thioredoxin 1
MFTAKEPSMGAALELTMDNFDAEVLQNPKPVLVDFWAPWCGPCKMIAPLIDQLAKTESHRFAIAKLNIDDAQPIAIKYGVGSIPTFFVFKGGEVVQKMMGANVRKEQFISALERAL